MTESELGALLDAHDALVEACVAGRLPFAEFTMAYGDFPQEFGLDGDKASTEWRRIVERALPRVEFHRRVASLLPGAALDTHVRNGPSGDAGGFLEKAVFLRLRQLLERYPGCRVAGAG
jgi:hypothetical protein